MYVFDYLPHRPHHYTTDPFVATSVITGAPSLIRKDAPSPFLTALLLSQNMHNVHHLMPTVPFYRYGLVWTACADELRRRGTRELPWLLWPSREAHLPELHAESHAKLE
jgi:fatty acid desaturase